MKWISILEFYIISTSFGGTLLVCLWCIFNNFFSKIISTNGTYFVFKAIIFFYFIPIVYFQRIYDMISDVELFSSVPIIGLINPYMSQILFMPFVIWLIGSIIAFGHNIYSHFYFYYKVLRYSALVTEPSIIEIETQISKQLRIRKPLPIYINDTISSPMLAGILFPKILIPSSFSHEDLTIMLYHENIHHIKHDLLFKQLGGIIRCLHWFNPFVYKLTMLINDWCEFNCDNLCCNYNSLFQRKEYAATLLKLATAPRMSFNLYYSAFCEKTSQLEPRIRRIATDRKVFKYAHVFAIIVSISFFIVGSLTVNAAGDKVLTYYYDWYYDTSTYIKEESVTIQETPLQTLSTDGAVIENELIDNTTNDDISNAMTLYFWKIKKNNGINCMKVDCKKGQLLYISNFILKQDLVLHHGIIDLDGNIHYVDGSSLVVFKYKIPEDGEYTIFIQNPNNEDVNINGTYYFIN
jgi:beta-lactamase regulating signal transducer with metallopeptidase domain